MSAHPRARGWRTRKSQIALARLSVRLIPNAQRGERRSSADSQLVDPLQNCAALPADDGVAIAADQRVGDGLAASRAIEVGERDGIGHAVSIISLP